MPSIGDGTDKTLRRMRETVELPTGRKAVLARVESLLNGGGVQKIVIEIGKPIMVDRLVDPAGVMEFDELPPEEEFLAARNGEIVELGAKDNWSALKVLFWAFQKAGAVGKAPRKLYVPSYLVLRTWLGLDKNFNLHGMFGIPIEESKELPDDGGLLVCGSADIFDGECFSIRIPITIKEKNK